MANTKIYIHEYIDIILQGRPKYMEHMTAGWGPTGRAERNMYCFGVWGTLGSTARWPEVINMWEMDGWEGIASSFAHETSSPSMQDPKLKVWWDEAQKYRSGGYDRVLIPAPWSPTWQDYVKTDIVGSKVFYHERIQVAPRKAKAYLEMLRHEWLPVAESLGLKLLGAFRTAMRNDSECIVIWGIKEWQDWARIEIAYENDPRVQKWRDRTDGIAIDWLNHLMCSAPLSPTQTGKQPG